LIRARRAKIVALPPLAHVRRLEVLQRLVQPAAVLAPRDKRQTVPPK